MCHKPQIASNNAMTRPGPTARRSFPNRSRNAVKLAASGGNPSSAIAASAHPPVLWSSRRKPGSNLHQEIEAAASDFRSSAERMNLPEFELADENCSSGNLEFNSSYAPVYNLHFPPPKKRLYMEDIYYCANEFIHRTNSAGSNDDFPADDGDDNVVIVESAWYYYNRVQSSVSLCLSTHVLTQRKRKERRKERMSIRRRATVTASCGEIQRPVFS
ncbi:PREDICTED: uncharacterized protein LOC105622253 [Atta cephalotes]|uniref:Uncharacterized protein n=1 Tax=Atta cephalotes TaxID=12957 RepID=A0A158NNF6_ATTCE|nr:PREDICTED: uncharacterized protein LOC105622253 [Atta cephalotes]